MLNKEAKNLTIYSPKIYLGKDENENEIEIDLASMEYVNKQLKAVKDLLKSHILNCDTAHMQSSNIEDQASLKSLSNDEESVSVVNMPEPRIKSVSAKAVKQDSEHRMITDAQLELFRKRPSKQEIQDMIYTAQEQLRSEMSGQFTNLLNMSNATEKLKKLSNLCNSDDDNFSTLMSLLDDTISVDEFNRHCESNKHVTNTDRKALNLLLECIDQGFMEQMRTNHIATADIAENARKLNGKTFSDICTSKLENAIFAPSGYSNGDIDYIFSSDGSSETDKTTWKDMLSATGSYGFKNGVYSFLDDDQYTFSSRCKRQSIITGCGDTVFEFKNTRVSNFICKHVCFGSNTTREATLVVGSNTDFYDCVFSRCHILLDNAYNIRFNHCRFEDGCRFTNRKSTMIILNENIFDSSSTVPKFAISLYNCQENTIS